MKRIISTSLFAFAFWASPLPAEVKLASPFTSHMVLQREKPAPVWGTAEAGEKVTVDFAGQKVSATAGADGKWRVDLQPMDASAESRTLTVTGSKTAQPIALEDVLVGEVWLASGQSNMVFPVAGKGGPYGLLNEEQEIAAANYPLVRMFTGRDTKVYEPKATVASGGWIVCGTNTVGGFSAVGYLFARNLQKELQVPVGILTEASGASCAEAWISREALAGDPQLKFMLDALDASENYFRAPPANRPAVAPLHPTPINKPRAAGGRGGGGDPAGDQHFATVLFNGMIAPVIPYAIRGALWYQGESIAWGTPGLNLYGAVQKALIKDWRARWGEGDFPFYLVQLPGQQNISNNPRIREEQASVLALPNTGMAVTIDTGEARNVHPKNKEPLGDRLTRIALANTYGRKMEYYGPMYEGMKVEGGAIRVTFTHLGGGLTAKGDKLKGFQIAGEDKKFVEAEAKIDGETLVISSAQVGAPVAVRYAWDNYPEGMGCNLYNAAGLPAA
ncbi:MAG: sialate O-acetylesterase, partial [Verrucomicrobiota bacterium]